MCGIGPLEHGLVHLAAGHLRARRPKAAGTLQPLLAHFVHAMHFLYLQTPFL